MANAVRDGNYVPVMLCQDATDPTNLLPVKVNPAT